jgi:hypothetical protein
MGVTSRQPPWLSGRARPRFARSAPEPEGPPPDVCFDLHGAYVHRVFKLMERKEMLECVRLCRILD